MNQLQTRNPQGFQQVNQMMNSGANPQNILKQMMGGSNPQHMQIVMQQAKEMGVPDNVLSQIQNFK